MKFKYVQYLNLIFELHLVGNPFSKTLLGTGRLCMSESPPEGASHAGPARQIDKVSRNHSAGLLKPLLQPELSDLAPLVPSYCPASPDPLLLPCVGQI